MCMIHAFSRRDYLMVKELMTASGQQSRDLGSVKPKSDESSRKLRSISANLSSQVAARRLVQARQDFDMQVISSATNRCKVHRLRS